MTGAVPSLHVVTDDAVLARRDFAETAARILAHADARVGFHVRGPGSDGRTLFDLARLLALRAAESDARLIVNGRADVALVLNRRAAPDALVGVQLGGRSLPTEVVRGLLGPDAPLGVSTHTDGEVTEAARDGADWIFAGTIYPSETHPDIPGRGPASVASAVETAGSGGPPVVAIGGLTPARVAEVREAGAYGVAVIRGIWDARDPLEALSRYLEGLE